MVADPFAPRGDTAVALDLSGLSFAALPDLRDIPMKTEERVTHVRDLLQAGDGDRALSYMSSLHRETALWSRPDVRALLRGLEGSVKLAIGAADASEADLLHALTDAKAAHRLTSPLGVSLLNNLSVLTFQHHHHATAAENQLKQALALIPDRTADRLNQRPICFRNLGIVQDSRGHQTDAAKSLRQALDETTRGPIATLDLIDILVRNRENADDPLAVEALRVAAFSMMERVREDFPTAFVAAARELSLFLLKNGELQRLGPIVEQQINVMAPLLSPPNQWRLTPAALLLALHFADGMRWAKAYEMIDWALALHREAPPDVSGPVEFFRSVTAHYRRAGFERQAGIAREVYRVTVAKRSKYGS